jgi:pimeloyl-ACP methyl ester carboxylesterase
VDRARFGLLYLARDTRALLPALGEPPVAAVVGHDFGAAVAAYCALVRPDVFPAVALMSAPFAGAPALSAPPDGAIHAALAALDPPRKHYQWYYTTRAANLDMWRAPQGVHDFLRAYYHHKSADWAANLPAPLAGWTAAELAKLPRYYVMDRDRDMAATVAREMPSAEAIAANRWLPEAELRVYSEAFDRTGFQGGLNWYRARSAPKLSAELALFAGRAITVPACFIAGAQDWGVFQKPGDLAAMQSTACTRLLGCHLLPGAGHWVQQEQPAAVLDTLLGFLARVTEGA